MRTEVSVPETRIVKLFWGGTSQAVLLPAEFRFEATEVYAKRDQRTGDVVLSTRPGARAWAGFFVLMRSIDVSAAFMADRPMNRVPAENGEFDDAE
jgi:antitoxin VapB